MEPPPNNPPEERRAEKRRYVGNYLVKLEPGKGRPAFTCFVWDISEGGIRLKMAENTDLDPVVHVLIGNDRKIARVVWRKADHVGLQFLEPKPKTPVPAKTP